MVQDILLAAPLYLLVAARTAGLIFTLPLFSMRTVSRVAKIALVGYVSYILMGQTVFSRYGSIIEGDGAFSIYYAFLILGEGMIGVIMGFYVSVIFAAFSSAAQFFAFQMGFTAASTYDQLSQVENPLLGQFFNFAAVLIFLQNHWFQIIFLKGLKSSFSSITVFDFIRDQNGVVSFLLKGLTNLFADAFVISLPVMGTLVLITVCTGLLSKAAPQMNLLSEGFPVMILLAFGLLIWIFPALCEFFFRSFNTGLTELFNMIRLSGAGGAS
ncbi:MAG: flagellar biosynthetic protein FliR [Treponema sp.]|nr:flagellar biosynthetic protein FliR [Treponema sp.]